MCHWQAGFCSVVMLGLQCCMPAACWCSGEIAQEKPAAPGRKAVLQPSSCLHTPPCSISHSLANFEAVSSPCCRCASCIAEPWQGRPALRCRHSARTINSCDICTLRPHMTGPPIWPLYLAADAPAAPQSPGKAGLHAGAKPHLGADSAEDAPDAAIPSLGSPNPDGRQLPRSSGMGARHDSGGAGAGSATLESGGSGSGGATAIRRPGFSWTNKLAPTQQVWGSQACTAKQVVSVQRIQEG